jgi:hypothetical protein
MKMVFQYHRKKVLPKTINFTVNKGDFQVMYFIIQTALEKLLYVLESPWSSVNVNNNRKNY